MGIWLELGIFIVVLVWAGWQWRDARQALERTRAQKRQEAEQQGTQPPPPPGA